MLFRLLAVFIYFGSVADSVTLADRVCFFLTGMEGSTCDMARETCRLPGGGGRLHIKCLNEMMVYLEKLYKQGVELLRQPAPLPHISSVGEWGGTEGDSWDEEEEELSVVNPKKGKRCRAALSIFTFYPKCKVSDLAAVFSADALKTLVDMFLVIPGFASHVPVKTGTISKQYADLVIGVDSIPEALDLAILHSTKDIDKAGLACALPVILQAKKESKAVRKELARLVVKVASDWAVGINMKGSLWKVHRFVNAHPA